MSNGIDYTFIKHSSFEKCKERLSLMREMNMLDIFGKAPIHYAIKKNSRRLVKFLILNGADVNFTDQYGLTPLHMAATDSRVSIIRLLLANGANPHACDEFEETPYLSAKIEGFSKAAALLNIEN